MALKLLLFDLDGTLLDTMADLTAATNAALASFGFGAMTEATCKQLVGNGARVLMRRALNQAAADGAQLNQATAEPTDSELVAAFNREYENRWHDKTEPYPGIMEMLISLKSAGFRLAIISNKPDPFTRKIAAHFFPEIGFEMVTGMQPDRPAKPDPTLALEICQLTGFSPAETALIGDSAVDMKTAVAAAIMPIGVTWGFRERDELLANGAKYLVDSAEALTALLTSGTELCCCPGSDFC